MSRTDRTGRSANQDDLRAPGELDCEAGDHKPLVDIGVSHERLTVGTEVVESGRVHARKHVEQVPFEETVSRGTEHAELEREPVGEVDTGEVLTLPDGSLSVPVFEEQIVITKRLVVRERVIIRKHTVYEDQVVSAELNRERLEVTTSDGQDLTPPP